MLQYEKKIDILSSGRTSEKAFQHRGSEPIMEVVSGRAGGTVTSLNVCWSQSETLFEAAVWWRCQEPHCFRRTVEKKIGVVWSERSLSCALQDVA